jgi:ferrochelatase
MTKRTAVVLLNLGGPNNQAAVEPFLFNLFKDPAILGVPQPFRWLLAKLISSRRAAKAQEIYAQMGGKSPILENTDAQATALEATLGDGYKVFIAMRYWHPFSLETAKQVQAYQPDEIILLPLYPQFSTTTTASSFKEWDKVAKQIGLTHPTSKVGCYPFGTGWVSAVAALIQEKVPNLQEYRLLFSAHGLPQKIVDAGDPYQWQVEQTVAAVKAQLGEVDAVVCYQSRVGPLQWLKPSTETEIHRAGEEKKKIAVIPIAFVSEHSETLVELDIEYQELAHEAGVLDYIRIPTVSTHPLFIKELAAIVSEVQTRQEPLSAAGGKQLCPQQFGKCGCYPQL